MRRSFIIILLFTAYALQSQVRISGLVVDRETKEPIVYATVSFPEKNIGTVSDGDGRFSIYIADIYGIILRRLAESHNLGR